jgi:hypothetical protein
MTATTKTKTCPSWCDWQHHGNADHDAGGGHSHTVLGDATGDHFACVALEIIGDEPPKVFVEIPDYVLTPDEALRVAAAMIEAVRLAGVTR